MKNKFLFVASCCTLMACDPVTIIGGGALVTNAASKEKGLEGVASDTELRSRINYEWTKNKTGFYDKVSLSVQNGRVVLMGRVPSPEMKIEAVRLTWNVKGVKEVSDEIKIGDAEGFGDYVRDGWISTKLKWNLLTDSRISSRNYSIVTVDKVVYLMGVAQNQEELDLVLKHAASINGVKNVVNHVVMKNQIKEYPTTPTSPSTYHPSSVKIQR